MFLEKMGHGINTWVIKNTLFLEISFTDYVLASYVFWWPYALSSLFLAPIKRLNCRNKLVSPCRDCSNVVLSGSPFPSPGEISPTGGASNKDLIGRLNKAASPAERGKQDGTT